MNCFNWQRSKEYIYTAKEIIVTCFYIRKNDTETAKADQLKQELNYYYYLSIIYGIDENYFIKPNLLAQGYSSSDRCYKSQYDFRSVFQLLHIDWLAWWSGDHHSTCRQSSMPGKASRLHEGGLFILTCKDLLRLVEFIEILLSHHRSLAVLHSAWVWIKNVLHNSFSNQI